MVGQAKLPLPTATAPATTSQVSASVKTAKNTLFTVELICNKGKK
jgi:hypothetical protein